jgi:fucose permease
MARGRNLGGRSGVTTGAGHITSGLAGGVAATIASLFGYQAIGIELTLLCVVMVTCMYLTVDRAYEAKRQARTAAAAVTAPART